MSVNVRATRPEGLRNAHAATLNLQEGVERGLPASDRLRAATLRPQHAGDAILRIAAIKWKPSTCSSWAIAFADCRASVYASPSARVLLVRVARRGLKRCGRPVLRLGTACGSQIVAVAGTVREPYRSKDHRIRFSRRLQTLADRTRIESRLESPVDDGSMISQIEPRKRRERAGPYREQRISASAHRRRQTPAHPSR